MAELTPDDLIGHKLVYTIVDYGNVAALRTQYTDEETPVLVNVEDQEYLQTLLGDQTYDEHDCFVLEFDQIAKEIA